MRTLDGQAWCSFCGASYGEPYHSRVFRVRGERVKLVYPAMIEYPEDIANNVPLCVECHSRHHSQGGMRLTFEADRITRADGTTTERMESWHSPTHA